MNNKIFIFLALIFGISILFRGLSNTDPFWVDEFNSGVQSRSLVNSIKQPNEKSNSRLESNNYLTHLTIAIAFIGLGESESTARLPFVIIGSLVPIAIYFLTRKSYDKNAAISATLLVVFSYFQITWSTQARGYVLQQLLSSLLFLSYVNLSSQKKLTLRNVLPLIIISLLGLATHNMFILAVLSMVLHFVIFNFNKVSKYLKNPFFLFVIGFSFTAIAYSLSMSNAFESGLIKLFNNLWYYHALLWREYSLVTFLAIVGAIWGLKKRFKDTLLFVIFIGLQLTFITFFFGHYMSKYTLPVFHFLLMFAGVGISMIGELLGKNIKYRHAGIVITTVLTLFIIVNGNKFVTKPKAFYSVNHDMRDIALVDYHRVYDLIAEMSGDDMDQVAVVDTWPDRPKWYLGTDFPNIYHLRWLNSGFRKNTNYYENDLKEKFIVGSNDKLIGELSDLEKAMVKYPKGFIWIDDTSLSADIIKYAEENFTKELYLDHYPLDDNPYSIWPGTLYSWGFDSYEASAAGELKDIDVY